MGNSMKGRVRPKFEKTNDKTADLVNFGSRVSSHDLWEQCEPNRPILQEEWPEEIVMFLQSLCRANDANGVELLAVNKTGKIKVQNHVDASQYMAAEQTILSMKPDKHNLLFSPIPKIDGKQLETVRMGWATVSNVHPFRLFPEPVAYWKVGPTDYQTLLPWHEPKTVENSCRDIEFMAEGIAGAVIYSTPYDALFLPGSLIHLPKSKPRTASILYDAFSTTQFEDFHEHRTDY